LIKVADGNHIVSWQ